MVTPGRLQRKMHARRNGAKKEPIRTSEFAKSNDLDFHLCLIGDHGGNEMLKGIVNASYFVIFVMLVGVVGSIFALVNGQPNDDKDDDSG